MPATVSHLLEENELLAAQLEFEKRARREYTNVMQSQTQRLKQKLEVARDRVKVLEELQVSKEQDTTIRDALCCDICYDMLDTTKILFCGHSYCPTCIGTLLNNAPGTYANCPLCGKPFRYATRNYAFEGIVERLLEKGVVKRALPQPVAPATRPAQTTATRPAGTAATRRGQTPGNRSATRHATGAPAPRRRGRAERPQRDARSGPNFHN
ncbi:hypothetical protein C8R46DRAFT_1211242 [Mycena filopes]|nr:hypothetical protein C8R46DRAFT_1211242 [Mycena filopes]